MNGFTRTRLIRMIALAGLTLTCSPVQAASVGYHAYAKHQHAQVTGLPKLYGYIPTHVPRFTNPGLVKFWLKNEFSPIFRNAEIQKQLCMAVTQVRNLNPDRFDRYHPLLG